ncbi:MAG: hypothetical protein A3I61_05340 [Acidobacteria bacterium RIFCSPLOWO2_02_FULL_68_18]|nr:MAG: hypothetical protein A3I61_05340 [Acidobacteria bacterium RIFCSPLOWO2_02_FULL_68_18]OFW49266.1 MAG: hypothetical protein A3G77_04140 [Acidobacteria bacterium RIFCSPLOWO2_12_FULL_68_19]
MKTERDVRRRAEAIAAHALGLVARDDEATPVPAHLEAAVMRAWEARGGAATRPQYRLRPAWATLAAAACAGLVAALWWTDARDTGSSVAATPAGSAADPSSAVAASALESFAPIDALLQEDPASLQLVRLSVQPSVLAALGYPVADPSETQALDVEVLIGLDGVPRAVRQVDPMISASNP